MSKFVFSNISNQISDDRFIPNRSKLNVEAAHYKLLSKNDDKNDIFNLKPKKLGCYKELLQKALNIDTNESSIYSFNNKKNDKEKKYENVDTSDCQWPCNPRKYPILGDPDIVLDWPNINADIYWNIADWGSNGYMATIWSRKVYLWQYTSENQGAVVDLQIRASGAIKWNHAGTLLAIGGFAGNFSIWDLEKKKHLYSASCYLKPFETCLISALAWDQKDTTLVSGCSNGYIINWGPNMISSGCVHAHKEHRIISLAFSTSNKFLCSSGTDSVIKIWNWPELEPHMEIKFGSPVRAIAFHPWRSSLLAVGGGRSDGALSIWNVSTCTQLGYHVPKHESMVDCLSWNRITGELVSSHRLLARRSPGGQLQGEKTKVLVLAGLEKVVDCIDHHDGRVLYLMWDKTGTRLATASSDECLCIWDFIKNPIQKSKALFNGSPATRQTNNSMLQKCIR